MLSVIFSQDNMRGRLFENVVEIPKKDEIPIILNRFHKENSGILSDTGNKGKRSTNQVTVYMERLT